MRIAIIGPTYAPGKTYQENNWCEQLARLGHVVRMYYAGRRTSPLEVNTGAFGSFESLQLRSQFLPRSTFSSRELAPAVRDFRPDLIVCHGDKKFAVPVARDGSMAAVPLIASFSENLGMHEFDWRKRGVTLKQRLWALGFRVVRAGPMRTVCRRATLLIGNTPQGRQIVLPLFNRSEREEIARKFIDMPLGFSPDHIRFDSEIRQAVRRQLGFHDDDVVVCVSSHFNPVKMVFVLQIIDALRQAMATSPRLKGLIVGFSDEQATAASSARIAESLASGGFAERFIKQPFANRSRLAELYCASDIAAFGRPSISCQEALGSGLVGCFADDGAVNHLVHDQEQAVFFRPNDVNDLAQALLRASALFGPARTESREAFRRRLIEASRWLGYDRLIQSILKELEARTAR